MRSKSWTFAPPSVLTENISLLVMAISIKVSSNNFEKSLSFCLSNNSDIKGVNFCFFGNINRRKGVPELLNVWEDPVFIQDQLHLCGRMNADVKELILGSYSKNIITPGFVNSFEYMINCDVFVLPSWQEGSAKAVYEAMASGLPAIVTHSTGSVIRDGIDGFVIDAGDIHTLKKRMIWFKDNPIQIKIMGQNAKERAQEFTWSRYANSLICQYKLLTR